MKYGVVKEWRKNMEGILDRSPPLDKNKLRDRERFYCSLQGGKQWVKSYRGFW